MDFAIIAGVNEMHVIHTQIAAVQAMLIVTLRYLYSMKFSVKL